MHECEEVQCKCECECKRQNSSASLQRRLEQKKLAAPATAPGNAFVGTVKTSIGEIFCCVPCQVMSSEYLEDRDNFMIKVSSRWRDCHSAGALTLIHLLKVEGGAAE